jgi:hypothetical protein
VITRDARQGQWRDGGGEGTASQSLLALPEDDLQRVGANGERRLRLRAGAEEN